MSTYSNRLQPAERPPMYASCMTISGGGTEQHVIIAGFLPCHWLIKKTAVITCSSVVTPAITAGFLALRVIFSVS